MSLVAVLALTAFTQIYWEQKFKEDFKKDPIGYCQKYPNHTDRCPPNIERSPAVVDEPNNKGPQ